MHAVHQLVLMRLSGAGQMNEQHASDKLVQQGNTYPLSIIHATGWTWLSSLTHRHSCDIPNTLEDRIR